MPAHVSELRGVVEREKAAIGVLITMHPPTRGMKVEAATAGFYSSPWGKHPRIQILTVEQLLAGQGVDIRPRAERASRTSRRRSARTFSRQLSLFESGATKRQPPLKAPLFDSLGPSKMKKGKRGA
jgi:hypothetical protein